jgi:hypothetical protein
VVYASQALSMTEHCYSTTHQECYAVICWIKHFWHYLFG